MKYKFTISNRGRSYSEEYDDKTIDIEWLENYSENELKDILCQNTEELDKTNGKHIIFGIVESLLQSRNSIPWMDSPNCQYKWEILDEK